MKGLRKKNNKGFSLVELIVVVLIIGILGVALAPNVIKWVNNARQSSDESNRTALEASINTAVADYLKEPGRSIEDEIVLVIKDNKYTTNLTETENVWTKALYDCIEEVLNGSYPKTQNVSTGFTVVITETGGVRVYIGSVVPET